MGGGECVTKLPWGRGRGWEVGGEVSVREGWGERGKGGGSTWAMRSNSRQL